MLPRIVINIDRYFFFSKNTLQSHVAKVTGLSKIVIDIDIIFFFNKTLMLIRLKFYIIVKIK